MFDRKAYMKEYYGNRYKRRKAEGRCVSCGVELAEECTTIQCEPCREKGNERSKQQWIKKKRKMFRELLEESNHE